MSGSPSGRCAHPARSPSIVRETSHAVQTPVRGALENLTASMACSCLPKRQRMLRVRAFPYGSTRLRHLRRGGRRVAGLHPKCLELS
jgi:hypothetical protein